MTISVAQDEAFNKCLPTKKPAMAGFFASVGPQKVGFRGSGSNGTVNALKPSTCPQTSALSGEYDKTTVL